jgi:hypothetical protein
MSFWNNLNDDSKKYYTFTSKLHVFNATVDTITHVLNIGGKYNKCVNITANINGSKTHAYIDHIQSEPECTLDTILENSQASEMIRASIQFCKHMYPELTTIELSDASNIECGIKAPRKRVKPFSLPHLSIATNKQTWYEKHFGAKYKFKSLQEKYVLNKLNLDKPIDVSFDEFAKMNILSEYQRTKLESYYNSAKSWYDFFISVPKEERCELFFNWLSTFINMIIDNSFNMDGWAIDYDSMEKTEISHIKETSGLTLNGGSHKKRSTRKNGSKSGFILRHIKKGHSYTVL